MKKETVSINAERDSGDEFRALVIREGLAKGEKITQGDVFARMMAWYRGEVERWEAENPAISAL